MDHIMDPSLTLLNTKIPPFRFRHQMGFRDQLGYVLGQHDMPVKETREGREFGSVLGYSMLGKCLHTKPRDRRKEKPVSDGSLYLTVGYRQLEIKANLYKSSKSILKSTN